MKNKQHIIKIKQGSPFQFMAISIGYLFIMVGIYLSIFLSQAPITLTLTPVLIGFFIIFLRNEFWIDTNEQLLRNTRSVLGLKYGKWHQINEFKAITIKYTILSDKNRDKGVGISTQIFSLVRYSENQYSKDETWMVHLLSVKNEKFQILDTSKENALKAVTYLLQVEDQIKPYLANFKPEFELSKPQLKNGQLTLIKPRTDPKRR